MSTTLQVIKHTFNEHPVTTYIFDGRPCWVALEVGRAIGYAGNGKGLTDLIASRWSDDLVAGHDFDVLTGEKLKHFQLIEQGVQKTPSSVNQMTILYETGLWLVLTKTHRPAGKVLRRELAEKVLPQLARDGRYLPEREVTPQGVMVESEHARRMRELDVQEQAVQAQLRDLDMRDRQAKAQALVALVDSLPYLPEDMRQVYRVKAAEHITGHNLSGLLPPAPSLIWESPTEIGARIGRSARAVGIAAGELGLKVGAGVEGMSRVIANKSPYSNREVPSWLYSPEAVAKIEEHLKHRPVV